LGHVLVKATVCTIDKLKCVEVEGLVDTGATLTVIPRSIAEELGLKIIRRDVVETGAGLVEIDRGLAIISIAGREVVTEVWISNIISRVLIGTTMLEMMGLKVDPRTGKLEPSPLLLYNLLLATDHEIQCFMEKQLESRITP